MQDEWMEKDRATKALHVAASKGQVSVLRKLLLDHESWDLGRTTDRSGRTALIIAATVGSSECVRELIPVSEANARTFDGRSALTQAAAYRNVECARELLKVCDPRVRGQSRRTALMMAAQGGSVELVQLLLPVSQLEATDNHRQTALLLAVEAGRAQCLPELLKSYEKTGSDRQRTRSGESALLLAARRQSHECLRLLLEHNRDWALDCDNKGMTAFLHAASLGDETLLQMLWGASHRQARNKQGHNALTLALVSSHQACAERLAPELPEEADAENNAGGSNRLPLPRWAARREREQLAENLAEHGKTRDIENEKVSKTSAAKTRPHRL